MARNGTHDDSGDYPASEPTQYADYGTAGEAYSEYGPPTGYGHYGVPVPPTQLAPAPIPWHQRPAVLVGFGVLTAVVLALLVYAVVKFTTAGNSESPAGTSGPPLTSAPERTPAEPTAPQQPGRTGVTEEQPTPSSAAPAPSPTEVTTSASPTATEAPAPSVTVSPSVTTVTETTTKHLFPTFPRPNRPTNEVPAGG